MSDTRTQLLEYAREFRDEALTRALHYELTMQDLANQREAALCKAIAFDEYVKQMMAYDPNGGGACPSLPRF